jgi:hypothetical protein
MEENKICVLCKENKPTRDFNKKGNNGDFQSFCRKCQSTLNRERYIATKQNIKFGQSLSLYSQIIKDILTKKRKQLRILSLGGGVQSSCLALMITKGEVEPIDAAIFADTGSEPQNVYEWLDYLIPKLNFPVYIVRHKVRTLEEEIQNCNKGRRWCGVPFFVNGKENKLGQLKRQCTSEYKIIPIQNKIRELLQIEENRRTPSTILVKQLIGISIDEASRMKDNQLLYCENVYPLIDLNMSRGDCLEWMKKNGYKEPPKSACVFCPYHSDYIWNKLKTEYPEEFQKAVLIDKKIRNNIRGAKSSSFLHRSLKPLDEVVFKTDDKNINNFNNECEGMCGV